MIWLLACAPPAPPAAPPPPAEDPQELALAAARKARTEKTLAAVAGLDPAPTRERYGLTVGVSEHAAVAAWIADHGLRCAQFPSPTRGSFQYRCDRELPAELLTDRTLTGGALTQVLLVRGEDAPVHFYAATRRYSAAIDAAADYDATLDALTATYGAAKKETRAGAPEVLEAARIVRNTSTWLFRDLEIDVLLLRVTGNTYTVQESWQVPGVEGGIPTHDRTGSLSGAPGKKPPAWNPHVSTAPTIE